MKRYRVYVRYPSGLTKIVIVSAPDHQTAETAVLEKESVPGATVAHLVHCDVVGH
jgi:hypothetical protein